MDLAEGRRTGDVVVLVTCQNCILRGKAAHSVVGY